MQRILLFGLLAYLGVGVYLYFAQRSFIYFPVKEKPSSFENVIFLNDSQRIKATVLNRNKHKAILYFGGNAEDVDTNAENFSRLFSGYSIYLVKYRGYAGSTGTPSEPALYSDAIHIYDALTQHYDRISVIGRSLGSAVATYVASKRPVDQLALITPFDSLRSIAQSQFLIYPMQLLLKDQHDSYRRAKRITAETLILAAEQDRVVKVQLTKRLIEAFPSNPEFHIIKDVGHNTISNSPDFSSALHAFF